MASIPPVCRYRNAKQCHRVRGHLPVLPDKKMKKSRSIAGIAVGVSVVVLIAAGFVAERAIRQLASVSDAVVRAKELELGLERLLSTLRDAETGQRGYLLSGDDEYLVPYDEALGEIDARMHTVTVRSEASGVPDAELRALRVLVSRKLQELARTIELYRNGQR